MTNAEIAHRGIKEMFGSGEPNKNTGPEKKKKYTQLEINHHNMQSLDYYRNYFHNRTFLRNGSLYLKGDWTPDYHRHTDGRYRDRWISGPDAIEKVPTYGEVIIALSDQVRNKKGTPTLSNGEWDGKSWSFYEDETKEEIDAKLGLPEKEVLRKRARHRLNSIKRNWRDENEVTKMIGLITKDLRTKARTVMERSIRLKSTKMMGAVTDALNVKRSKQTRKSRKRSNQKSRKYYRQKRRKSGKR